MHIFLVKLSICFHVLFFDGIVLHREVQQTGIDEVSVPVEVALQVAEFFRHDKVQAEHRFVDHELALVSALCMASCRGDRLFRSAFLVDGKGHEIGRLRRNILSGVLLISGGNLEQMNRVAAGRHVKGGDAVLIGLGHSAFGIRAELHSHTLNRVSVRIDYLNLIAAVCERDAA